MALMTITKDNIEEAIKDNDILVLDFWAAWCGPCRAFAPTFEASAEKHPAIGHGKIDTEANRELGAALEIRSIPTIMVFREGILVFRQPGALPAPALEDLLTKVQGLDMEEVRARVTEGEQAKAEQAEA